MSMAKKQSWNVALGVIIGVVIGILMDNIAVGIAASVSHSASPWRSNNAQPGIYSAQSFPTCLRKNRTHSLAGVFSMQANDISFIQHPRHPA